MKLFGFQFNFHFDDYCVQKSFAEDQPNMNSASSDFCNYGVSGSRYAFYIALIWPKPVLL